MDKKQLYTALSRTTKFEYIHLNKNEINSIYKIRQHPNLELINSRFNSQFNNGKIYEIKFDNDKIYIGSTCEELEKRLEWHLKNKNSQVYKNRKYNPKTKLIVNAPSESKKSLEKVENGYIQEYSELYGDNLINIRSNPLKKRPVQYESRSELELRIAKLNDKIKIKDDVRNASFFYTVIDGKRYATTARYTNCKKEEALENINLTKQKKIELTLYFN